MGEEKSAEQQELVKDAPFPLTDVDKWVLSQTDEEWHSHDWVELKEIIGEQQATSKLICLKASHRSFASFIASALAFSSLDHSASSST